MQSLEGAMLIGSFMAYLPSDAETSDASFATTLTCSSAAGGAALEPCAKLMDATPSGDAPDLKKKESTTTTFRALLCIVLNLPRHGHQLARFPDSSLHRCSN